MASKWSFNPTRWGPWPRVSSSVAVSISAFGVLSSAVASAGISGTLELFAIIGLASAVLGMGAYIVLISIHAQAGGDSRSGLARTINASRIGEIIFEKISQPAHIRIFGSGSETYYVSIRTMLNEMRGPQSRVSAISIIVRGERSPARRRKLEEMINKWTSLAHQVGVQFHHRVTEFEVSPRGIAVGDLFSYFGLYVRRRDETIGQEYPLFLVDSSIPEAAILNRQIRHAFDAMFERGVAFNGIKCAVFDLHGTLVRDQAWAQVAHAVGVAALSDITKKGQRADLLIEKKREEIQRLRGYSPSLTECLILLGVSKEDIARKEREADWPSYSTVPDPQLRAMLNQIGLVTERLILTNNSTFVTELMLAEYGIRDCFDEIISREKLEYPKPHAGIFLELLKRKNLRADEIVVFGDRFEIDLAVPKSLGMKTYKVDENSTILDALNRCWR